MRRLWLILAALLYGAPAFAQMGVAQYGIPVSRGAGAGSFQTVGPCLTGVPLLGAGVGANPACGGFALGNMAAQAKTSVDIQGGTITGMPNPTNSTDVANKQWVLSVATGLNPLPPSRLATAAILPNAPTYANGALGVGATLTAGSNTTLTVDSTLVALNDIVLVKDQASAFQNGIYKLTTAGSGAAAWVLTRATYFDQAAEMIVNSSTAITSGATNVSKTYILNPAVATVGTDPVTFLLSFTGGSVTAGEGGIVPTTNAPTTLYIEQMEPGGRLTLVSGSCNTSTDQVAATTLYYSPCGGEWIPVYDGTQMRLYQFTSGATDTAGLSHVLDAGMAAATIFDEFVGLNGSTLTLCSGPAWVSSTAGSSSRGTGAGTSELQIYKGMYTNKVSMTCRYSGGATFTCAVNQCTYVGTELLGAGAGTIDLKFGTAASGGGAAVLSICNAYNRADIVAHSSDTGGGPGFWNYSNPTWRVAHAGATQVGVVTCNADVVADARYVERASVVVVGGYTLIGIGIDTAVPNTDSTSSINQLTGAAGSATQIALVTSMLGIGLHNIYALEQSDGNPNIFWGNPGTQAQMLTVKVRM